MSAIAKRIGFKRAYPVAASQVLNSNVPVLLNASGCLVGVVGNLGQSAGVLTMPVDNSAGTDGAITAEAEAGEHKFANSGDITIAHVGSTAYFASAAKLSIDDATATRAAAGVITQVDGDGVWVALGV